jgi:hypothetical protein
MPKRFLLCFAWCFPPALGFAWGWFGGRLVGPIWAVVITLVVGAVVIAWAARQLVLLRRHLALLEKRRARLGQWMNARWQ